MEEAKRFLRYIIPGLTSYLQIIVCLMIYDISQIESYIKLDVAVTAFFASGVLGYIFSKRIQPAPEYLLFFHEGEEVQSGLY